VYKQRVVKLASRVKKLELQNLTLKSRLGTLSAEYVALKAASRSEATRGATPLTAAHMKNLGVGYAEQLRTIAPGGARGRLRHALQFKEGGAKAGGGAEATPGVASATHTGSESHWEQAQALVMAAEAEAAEAKAGEAEARRRLEAQASAAASTLRAAEERLARVEVAVRVGGEPLKALQIELQSSA